MSKISSWNEAQRRLWLDPPPVDQTSGNRLINLFLPKNPVTAKREFHLLPFSVERSLCNWYNQLLMTGMPLTFKKNPEGKKYQKVVDEVLAKLIPHIPTWKGQLWPFKVTVISNKSLNAGALRGGQIIFYDHLIKTIYRVCGSEETKNILIKSGKDKFRIDLQDIKPEAVIASILGHEMTHVCARHISSRDMVNLIWKSLKKIFKNLFGISDSSQGSFLNEIVLLRITSFFYLIYKLQSLFHIFFSKQLPAKVISYLKLNNSIDGKELEKKSAFFVAICLVASYAIYKIARIIKSRQWRNQEFESDKWGMIYAARANFDPRGALLSEYIFEMSRIQGSNFIRRLLEIDSTHPMRDKRVHAIVEEIKSRSPDLISAV